MVVLFWFSLLMILYIYLGYPLLLSFLPLIVPRKSSRPDPDYLPPVTIIIAAYNEAEIIGEKLKNTLEIDYPPEKMEIIVVSDASDDGTDEIVMKYAGQGVRLIRQPERRGKTAGLNVAVEECRGEILVFSDANPLYEKSAIRNLIRHFVDPEIGCVVGEARYKEETYSRAGESENAYWKYELWLRRKESEIGSMVGGDGAIYSVRKGLYEPLRPEDINDFVNPLQVVLKGKRVIFDPEALCYEAPAADFSREFNRKSRIVNRSWTGLFRLAEVLNPLRTGLFSIQVLSHKLLRWIVPYLLLILLASNTLLFLHGEYTLFFVLQLLFYLMFFFGYFLKDKGQDRLTLLFLPFYFFLVNLAAFAGIYKAVRGEVQVTWKTARDRQEQGENIYKWVAGYLFVGVFFLFSIVVADGLLHHHTTLAVWSFCIAGLLILYIYAGYPACLWLLTRIFKKGWQEIPSYVPDVTMMVAALNEELVIEEKIKNSLKNKYPKEHFSIAIGSDGSTDGTNDIVQRYVGDGVKLFDYPIREGKMTVLNKTVPKIESEIIVFSDANTFYEEDAVERLVRPLADPTVGAVSGNVIQINDEVPYGKSEKEYYRYERYLQRLETMLGSMVGVDGAMYAIRKDLYPELPDNIILDDFVISIEIAKQGKRVVYSDAAVAHEDSPATIREEFNRKARVIAGGMQCLISGLGVPGLRRPLFLWQYLSHKVLRWFAPLLLITVFCSNLFLIRNPLFMTFFSFQVLFYLFSGVCALGFGRRQKLFSLPFYFCMTNTAALFGIYRGLTGRQNAVWDRTRRVLRHTTS